mmetsp:Transcript_93367/g.250025  ORF Transcript_93367/g.250025 Transcript_93367/m.250025 type:complete len:397 (+) Transcript_93367:71-1261(+)
MPARRGEHRQGVIVGFASAATPDPFVFQPSSRAKLPAVAEILAGFREPAVGRTRGSARCERRCHVDVAWALLGRSASARPVRSRLDARIPGLGPQRRRSILRSIPMSNLSLLAPEPMSAELIVQCCEKFGLSLRALEALVVCEMGLDATFGCREEFEALIGAPCTGWQGTAGGLWQIQCEVAVEDLFGSRHKHRESMGWVARTFVRVPGSLGQRGKVVVRRPEGTLAGRLGHTTASIQPSGIPTSTFAPCMRPTAATESASLEESALGCAAHMQYENSATAIVPAPELTRLSRRGSASEPGLPARCTFRSATWVQLMDGTVQAMLTTDENPTVRCLHEALVSKCLIDGLRNIAWSPERQRFLASDRQSLFHFLSWVGKQVKFDEIWIREVLPFLSC